jgi:uncharacterized protein YoxC
MIWDGGTMDDLNRRMEFIIEHQAQFAADIQQLKEQHRELLQQQKELLQQQKELVEQHKGFVGNLDQVLGLVARLAGAQENTNALVANLAERIGDLTRTQIGTDQRLNTLISIFERHISNHNND